MNHTSMLDNIGLGDILLQVFLQQALYKHRIRSNSAEECRRFKGTRAGMQCKMLRVNRNTRKQCSRL
ncbi:hypothetical protein D3C76_1555440 [compost metagenome]